jgi:hypothetical protein
MYKYGLKFPIHYFFIFDDIKINSIDDIKNQRNILYLNLDKDNNNEENFNRDISYSLNKEMGFELIPSLLNYFPDLIQSDIKFKKEDLQSLFIKDNIKFREFINHFKFDFISFKSLLKDINEIAIFDEGKLYRNLYLFFYRIYFIRLSSLISYSNDSAAELYLDFNKDFNNFVSYSKELAEFSPVYISSYEKKLVYVQSFYKSFKTRSTDEVASQIEIILKYTPRNIKITFLKLIIETFHFKPGVNAKRRNKLFKPIYANVMGCVSGKVYYGKSKDNSLLTNDVQRFFSDIDKIV